MLALAPTEIFTTRGWITPTDLRQEEDDVIGYNLQTKRLEWILGISVRTYIDTPTVRITNGAWSIVTTADQHWYTVTHEIIQTSDITKETKLLVSAPPELYVQIPLALRRRYVTNLVVEDAEPQTACTVMSANSSWLMRQGNSFVLAVNV